MDCGHRRRILWALLYLFIMFCKTLPSRVSSVQESSSKEPQAQVFLDQKNMVVIGDSESFSKGYVRGLYIRH